MGSSRRTAGGSTSRRVTPAPGSSSGSPARRRRRRPSRPRQVRPAAVFEPQEPRMSRILGTESHFLLENDVSLIPDLVGYFSHNAARMRLCDGTGLIRVNVALSEALSNAILHGNLELDSAMREDDEAAYYELGRVRRYQDP